MKLKEIPNYLNEKVRCNGWPAGKYVWFDGLIWKWEDGNDATQKILMENVIKDDAWEVFHE